MSAALARVADVEAAGAAEGVRGVRELGLTDEEIAEGVLREFHFEEIASLIDYAHRLQLRAAVLRRLARPTATDTLTLAVGFIDLVGYTALVEELDDDALAALVEHFAAVAFDTVAAGGARVVKTIGDAVMFVADDPATAARVALRLARAPRDDPLLPEARIGVACGPVVARAGDYYGAVVNLASRLTEGARPGTVLVSAEVHDALAADPSFAFVDLGLRKLRDIGRVPVFVLRSAGAESQAAPAGS